jgi:RNA polymerase sigma-70 factor (ECF subfamily)
LDQLLLSASRESVTIAAPEALERDALIQTMYQIIETELTDRQRTALLAELRGMPLAEIGRRLGSNRNAVYKLTHDARQRLKKGLEAAGYSMADLQTA